MHKHQTIGEVFDQSIARAEAEMRAGRAALSASLPLPGDLNSFDLMVQHMIEAMDALLVAAGSCGDDKKWYVLQEAAARHRIQIKDVSE